MQSSIRGFWCSLAHQLLSKQPKLIDRIIMEFPSATTKEEHHDWSINELERLLLYIIKELRMSLCLFIDGLDEVYEKDGADVLIDALNKILQQDPSNIKICVSSRPEDRYMKRLEAFPSVRLHQLLRNDMTAYVSSRLKSEVPNFSSNSIIKMLVDKAQGVFLWLELVLNSIIRGVKNGDSDEEIELRIQQLPGDIEALYTEMWDRLNEDEPIYRESAALMLRLTILANSIGLPSYRGISLLEMFFALCQSTEGVLELYDKKPDLPRIETACLQTGRNLSIRCAGLLVLQKPDLWGNSERAVWMKYARYLFRRESDISKDHPMSTVSFVHRTAYDYLTSTSHGQRIADFQGQSSATDYLRLVRGFLSSHSIDIRGDWVTRYSLHLLSKAISEEGQISDQCETLLQLCCDLTEQDYMPDSLTKIASCLKYNEFSEVLTHQFYISAVTYDVLREWVFSRLKNSAPRLLLNSILYNVLGDGPRWRGTDIERMGSVTENWISTIYHCVLLGADPAFELNPTRYYYSQIGKFLQSPQSHHVWTLEVVIWQCLFSLQNEELTKQKRQAMLNLLHTMLLHPQAKDKLSEKTWMRRRGMYYRTHPSPLWAPCFNESWFEFKYARENYLEDHCSSTDLPWFTTMVFEINLSFLVSLFLNSLLRAGLSPETPSLSELKLHNQSTKPLCCLALIKARTDYRIGFTIGGDTMNRTAHYVCKNPKLEEELAEIIDISNIADQQFKSSKVDFTNEARIISRLKEGLVAGEAEFRELT